MGAWSAIHSLRWSAPSMSWNAHWRMKKGKSRMSHRAGLDRSTVVEAAARLVDEEGIEQLTLARLAERLGVRTPSLYNHVAGLPGLKHDQEVHMLANQLVDVARAILAPYHLSEEDAIHAIRGLRSIVHGFILLEEASGFRMPVNLDASFHWLMNLFITGLERNA